MKYFTFIMFVMMITPIARAEFELSPVQVPIQEALIPNGLNRTENAFVVVAGRFPNGCYEWLMGEVTHLSQTAHVVRAIATVNESSACTMIMIPFKEQINFGILPAGEYTIRFLTDGGEFFERKLIIL